MLSFGVKGDDFKMADFSMFSPDGVNTLNVKDAPARNMVTDAFSTSTAYAVGDYCIYNGVLYRCSTAHEGAWTSGDFTATTIAEELKNAGGDAAADPTHKRLYISSTGTYTITFPAEAGAITGADAEKSFYAEARLRCFSTVMTDGECTAAACFFGKDSVTHITNMTYNPTINQTNYNYTGGTTIKLSANRGNDSYEILITRDGRTFTITATLANVSVVLDLYAIFV